MKKMVVMLVLLLGGMVIGGELQLMGVLGEEMEDTKNSSGVEARWLQPIQDDFFAEGMIGLRNWKNDGEDWDFQRKCLSISKDIRGDVEGSYLGAGVGILRRLPFGLIGQIDVNAKYMVIDCDVSEVHEISWRHGSKSFSQDYELDDTVLVGVGLSLMKPITKNTGMFVSVGYDFDLDTQEFECAETGEGTGMDFDAGGWVAGLGVAFLL